jgi:hypothetical protein
MTLILEVNSENSKVQSQGGSGSRKEVNHHFDNNECRISRARNKVRVENQFHEF